MGEREGEGVAAVAGLEPSVEEMAQMIDAVVARLLPHVASLGEQPASYHTEDGDDEAMCAALSRKLREPMPEEGEALSELLQRLFDEALPTSYNAPGPGYLAYVPGGGVFHAALGDLIANAVNRYTGVWVTAPGLIQLEANVLRWFCEMVGYPATSGGLLTSGGSLATLTALTTARRERLPENFLKGTLYTSDQSHHSVQKAAMLAGFPVANVRVIPSDRSFRIHIPSLRDQIARDRAEGMQPFCLVAHAGTTNTGAVDPLDELADIATAEGLWMHVDAAYGGFFVLTDHGQQRLQGLSRADSITLDPHKGLFLPYGTGALVVKDLATLRRTHSADGDYMPAMQDEEGLVDFCAISPELSRDYRGLRVWLPLKMCGVATWRAYLDEKIQLARWITDAIGQLPGVEVIAPPELSLLAFRYVGEGLSLAEQNRLNQRWISRVNAKQRVLLTGTWVPQRDDVPPAGDDGEAVTLSPREVFVLRICVLCFRTHQERMTKALEDLTATLPSLTGEESMP